ncbi:MAG: hypothetical protein JST92_21575, partial [Deltaproteobacteria bacterium]|nr:hypothetical protein [Deltaproteobacteria bacterium]
MKAHLLFDFTSRDPHQPATYDLSVFLSIPPLPDSFKLASVADSNSVTFPIVIDWVGPDPSPSDKTGIAEIELTTGGDTP